MRQLLATNNKKCIFKNPVQNLNNIFLNNLGIKIESLAEMRKQYELCKNNTTYQNLCDTTKAALEYLYP